MRSLYQYNEEMGKRNLFFEAAVDAILNTHSFLALRIGELGAVEIDFPEDYEAARRLWTQQLMS